MTIQISIEVQEAQFILSSLAKAPFEQVADLWFKIKQQAEQQIAQQQAQQPSEDHAPGLNDPGQA